MSETGDGAMTTVVHAGEEDNASAVALWTANAKDGLYTRHANPTVAAFEAKMQALEGGAAAVAMASGMAAVSQTLLSLLRQGDRLVVPAKVFVGVRTLLSDFLPHYGIDVAPVDMNDRDALRSALEAPGVAAVYCETISNPWAEAVDVPGIVAVAREAGVPVIVDNTLATPHLFRPIEAGADIVLHSASKYIGGHGDAIGGVVVTREAGAAEPIRTARRILGGILSPANAYLLQRGLKTLSMRMERHCANAEAVAAFLAGHPKVRRVNYPGLESAPDHATAASFLPRFGGLLSFELHEQFDHRRLVDALTMCKSRYSFGEPGTVALIQDWIRLIRLSVGLEDAADIVADLSRALDDA
ncbi:trans-sulfuration enzyme family protein [Ferruginivarius sediminum]|uniref:PLP-dependent transferase n=1 Tax=Ferruginivarius sediminum TaxID=2661937 RepID=A0A369TG59_9PROT|nr:PLP-dependent aspartate aminotransferase family protein [Ferruginivarius sediminum]RDD61886.1 PLP-dependent transferase [Ferruginivarius sediminum]